MRPLRLDLEVARTAEARERGLMHRRFLPVDRGMLFLFERTSRDPFWNANTLLPLRIAFLGEDGRVVDVQNVAPIRPGEPPTRYVPALPYRYAIEAGPRWFDRSGLRVGDVVRLPRTMRT